MGTLKGFAAPFGPPPAITPRRGQSRRASHAIDMGTLKGFVPPFGPPRPPPPRSLRSASPNPRAMVRRRRGRARSARGGQGRAVGPEVPVGGKAGGLPTRLTWEP